MPWLTIDRKKFQVEAGTRLVLAIREAGVHIGHRCGGESRCTDCQVRFLEGEPDTITEAEYNWLVAEGLWGQTRLSCQIEVDRDMSVQVLDTVENHPEWKGDPGPVPSELVTPEAVWYPIDADPEDGQA